MKKILSSKSESSKKVMFDVGKTSRDQKLPSPKKIMETISEEFESSDDEDDVKDTPLAIEYITSMHHKIYTGKKLTN